MTKKQEYLFIIGLLILIFPFFALILFVHPQGDDFFFAIKVNELGIFPFVKDMYMNWSGRYASMFLGAMNPWKNESLLFFRLYLLAFQGVFIISLFYLFKQFAINLGTNKVMIFTLFFYLIFLHTIPNLFQFLYYYPSVSAYQIGASAQLIFISLFIASLYNYITNNIYLTLSIILTIFIIGLNELFIIPLGCLSILFILIKNKQSKSIKYEMIILSIIIIFSLVVVLAPGNYQRIQCYSNNISISSALLLSAKSFVSILGYYLQSITFILSSLLFVFILKNQITIGNIRRIDISRKQLFFSFFISLIILVILLFPAIYSLKCNPLLKVMNHLAFYFFFIWFSNLYLLSNYYSYDSRPLTPTLFIKVLAISILISIFSSAYITNYDKHWNKTIFFNGNYMKVNYTLFFQAKTYDKEITERYDFFSRTKSNLQRTIIIKALTFQPDILVEMPCNNTKSDYIPNNMFLREKQYYKIDTIYCIKND